eukprot:4639656-Prymnesium_polylepis.1
MAASSGRRRPCPCQSRPARTSRPTGTPAAASTLPNKKQVASSFGRVVRKQSVTEGICPPAECICPPDGGPTEAIRPTETASAQQKATSA